MPYVLQRKISVTERRRNRLNQLSSWVYSRLIGTFFQNKLIYYFNYSWITQYSLAIILGLLVGLIIDINLSLFSLTSLQFLSYSILGSIVCFIAFGGGGIPIGFLVGWLVGSITDSIANELLSNRFTLFSKFITWFIVCIISWLIGVLATWVFEKIMQRFPSMKKIIITIFIVTIISSASIILYQVYSNIFPFIKNILLFVKHHFEFITLVISFFFVILFPIILYRRWSDDPFFYSTRESILKTFGVSSSYKYLLERSDFDKINRALITLWIISFIITIICLLIVL